MPHGDSLARRAWRTAGRMFTDGRATRELAELAAAAQMPLATGRRLAVVAMHGGAGRSTVAALLASVFAARRREPVLAADADPDAGSLAWRLGLPNPPPLSALAPALLTARGGDLRGFERLLPHLPTGLWVLPGGAPGQPQLCRDVTRALSRLFAVSVTDCAGGVQFPATREVLAEAHAVVVVCAATPDAVRGTYAGLTRFAGGPAALSRTVVVLNTTTVEGRAALREDVALSAFSNLGVPVVTLPYDRHLAAGTPLTPSRIGEATLVEATRLAGTALSLARQL